LETNEFHAKTPRRKGNLMLKMPQERKWSVQRGPQKGQKGSTLQRLLKYEEKPLDKINRIDRIEEIRSNSVLL
jgi:hypothetical protein